MRTFAAILVLIGAVQVFSADRPPNIVLIVSDDQGYADLGCINKEVISPNLDRLAREGARLTNYYVSWCACTPSRAALLTGRYPQRNGVSDMIRNEAPDYGHKYSAAEYATTFERVGGMDEREILIPKLLKRAGYASAIFGKWDLGVHQRYLPTSRGFDEFYGFANTGIDYFTHERYGVPSMYRNLKPTSEDKGTYCTDLFGREAARFVTANKDKPFFLYLPFNAPHGASSLDPKIRGAAQAPEKYKKMYPHLKDDLAERKSKGGKQKFGEEGGEGGIGPSKSKARLEYLASITCMDDAIGRVLQLLDEYKLADNTLVIFFSDNGGSGGSSNAPLTGKKTTMWEGGIRVCCVMRYPGKIPAGTVSDAFLTSLELMPTFLKLAGVQKPADLILDGYDMLPTLAGKAPSPRGKMFWRRRDHIAARVGDWKYQNISGKEMLFNLAEDVAEKKDLSKSDPAKLSELRAAVDGWHQEMEAAEPRGPFRDF